MPKRDDKPKKKSKKKRRSKKQNEYEIKKSSLKSANKTIQRKRSVCDCVRS